MTIKGKQPAKKNYEFIIINANLQLGSAAKKTGCDFVLKKKKRKNNWQCWLFFRNFVNEKEKARSRFK